MGRREKKEGESGPSQRAEERMGRWCQAGGKRIEQGACRKGETREQPPLPPPPLGGGKWVAVGWRRWLTVGTRWR